MQKPKRILSRLCYRLFIYFFATVLDKNAEIITVERNEKMIEKAKENIKEQGWKII